MKLVLELLAGAGNGVNDLVLMDGAAASEKSFRDGDADGAADVAHQVEEAAGVADLTGLQCAVGGGADGDEDEAQSETGDEDGEEECGGGESRVTLPK